MIYLINKTYISYDIAFFDVSINTTFFTSISLMTQIKVNHNLTLTTYDQSFNEVYSRYRSLETTNIQDPQDWSSEIYNILNSFNTPLACSSHPTFQNYTTTSSLTGLSPKL